MKVGVLTSSRADYGIYLPLLKRMHIDPFFELEVIAFGMHLLEKFGYTVDSIYRDGFKVRKIPGTMSQGDSPADIAKAMAATTKAFSEFFSRNNYQLIFALGDRYEMFSAVAASAPFNISIAHIHGGETTLGSIDNAFRHSITCFSKFHFTSTEVYNNRVKDIIGNSDHAYNVGALSIDNLKQIKLLKVVEFKERYGIYLGKPTILFTFHPETINYKKNKTYIVEIKAALQKLSHYQIVVTMPNADIMGLMIRNELLKAADDMTHIIIIETFGSTGYLSAMKHCSFMLGNTSSGFVEASYFSKPVINIGQRQEGRIITPNIITIPIKKSEIIQAVRSIENHKPIKVKPVYGTGKAALRIVEILKNEFK
jgi:GDP/UDP-N,N'-diacetylbacillosamine 2-epimerase (hydrolysing)